MLGGFFVCAVAQLRPVVGKYVARFAVNFHVLAAHRPVPRSLDDGLCFRISQDNRRLVVHFRVDFRFYLLRHGGYGQRFLAIHEPRHQVGPVTAKVNDGSAAVHFRVGQPIQKLLVHANFLRTRMPVVDHHLADIADQALLHHFARLMVGGIPSGFVIGQQMHLVLAGQGFHFPGVFQAHGQRLFDHDMDAARGAIFHYRKMPENAVEGAHGFRLRLLDHRFHARKPEFFAQVVLLQESHGQVLVRFGNAYKFHIAPVGPAQYPMYVVVGEADHADPQRRIFGGNAQDIHEKKNGQQRAKHKGKNHGRFWVSERVNGFVNIG